MTLPRPTSHLATAATWLNDPNGLVLVDGVWHAYYQTNPYGVDWGSMSWGHATSPDLATWTEQPVAIPNLGDGEEIYSGSVVVDHRGRAGFGAGALVAVYTSNYVAPHPRAGTSAQSLAASVDGGYTWTRNAGNPVLDRGSKDFRDPKVFSTCVTYDTDTPSWGPAGGGIWRGRAPRSTTGPEPTSSRIDATGDGPHEWRRDDKGGDGAWLRSVRQRGDPSGL